METTPIPPWKKLHDYRRANGLCPTCGKPLDRDGYYCTECRDKATQYQRDTRAMYKKLGICPQCGKNKLFGDEKVCPECLAYQARYRAEHPESEETRLRRNAKFKEFAKKRYAERKANGICVRCGKKKAAKGRVKCPVCLAKESAKHKEQRLEKTRQYRNDNHLCCYCGKPVERKDRQVCDACWEKHYRGMSK